MAGVAVVGVDCAAQASHLAIAVSAGREIIALERGLTEPPPAGFISGKIDKHGQAVIAIDAPLGWPTLMGRVLGKHRAGDPIEESRRELFTRETDREVHERLGITPLWVGADRIACTAHRAVELMGELRESRGPLPLLWDPKSRKSGVIEVYPAATLKARGLPHRGYKGKESADRDRRHEIVDCLEDHLDVGGMREELLNDSDKLDAVICVLAAEDFLGGRAVPPSRLTDQIRREGWIWARASCAA